MNTKDLISLLDPYTFLVTATRARIGKLQPVDKFFHLPVFEKSILVRIYTWQFGYILLRIALCFCNTKSSGLWPKDKRLCNQAELVVGGSKAP